MIKYRLGLLLLGVVITLNVSSGKLFASSSNSELFSSDLSFTPINYLGNYINKTSQILLSPLSWDQSAWNNTFVITGIASSAFLFDNMIKHNMQASKSKSLDQLTPLPNNILGDFRVMSGGAIVGWSVGQLTNDFRLQQTSRLALECLFFSAMIKGGMKNFFHRARPYTGSSSNDWKGPNGDSNPGRLSFPSGHSTCAFTIATVISEQYSDIEMVPWISYGLAALTAWSRVYSNKHWASDVIVGAAIGHYTAKMILGLENTEQSDSSFMIPFIGYSPTDIVMGLKLIY